MRRYHCEIIALKLHNCKELYAVDSFLSSSRRSTKRLRSLLLGPRQSGKTTLALELAARRDAVILDLESDADRSKLTEPELYLSDSPGPAGHPRRNSPRASLFPVLRGLIDRARRDGRRTGRYLLLGSASLDLLRQSGETLAGRVSYLELRPFDTLEVGATASDRDRLWLRGGFPEASWRRTGPEASGGDRTSSVRIWNAIFRSSAHASRPTGSGGCGRCWPIIRGAS